MPQACAATIRRTTDCRIFNTAMMEKKLRSRIRPSIPFLIGLALLLSLRIFVLDTPGTSHDLIHRENSNSINGEIMPLQFSGTTDSHTTVVIVAHCRENLSYLDHFGSCEYHRLQFIIMSKCNESVPEFLNISDCVTVQSVENCGTQEYAYFKYVIDNYDSLPSLVAFIQGGALTEKHITPICPDTCQPRGIWPKIKYDIR